jgi:hypothetical protein
MTAAWDPGNPPDISRALAQIPSRDVVLNATRNDRRKTTFYYHNRTALDLKIWVFSAWKYYQYIDPGRKADMAIGTTLPNSPWMRLDFPPETEARFFDINESRTTAWNCFFIEDREHDLMIDLGWHDLFASDTPTLTVSSGNGGDDRLNWKFDP